MSVKTSQIPNDPTPVVGDSVVGVKASGPTTQDFTLSSLITLFWALANIPTGATSPITRDNETGFAFVASGMVWSGDAYASTRNASMTTGICYINGRRISISSVTARTFTASVDTYIDVLDNGDGTGTLVYTTALNNAASPVLAANSLRIGIIVTGVSNIAAAGSVNQGQETMVLPIASSIAYAVTDSLGNLICPRDPQHQIIGYRQVIGNVTTTSASNATIAGLTAPVIVPTGRKIEVELRYESLACTGSTINTTLLIVEDATQIADTLATNPSANFAFAEYPYALHTPTAGAHSYIAQWKNNSAGLQTSTINANSTSPFALVIRLK